MVLDKQHLPVIELKQDAPKPDGPPEDKKDIDDVSSTISSYSIRLFINRGYTDLFTRQFIQHN